ncbi:MAG TPA: DUF3619 family protein [Burkholderiaceae bacterium]|nr:DUF3619 family protein [Burkholderiaceae bacterium]
MNDERLFAYKVRQALEESAERLPYRVTQRLERARLAALAHAERTAPAAAVVAAGSATVGLSGEPRTAGWLRVVATAVPILVVVLGLYGISAWDDVQRAAETADIDAELVLSDDDIPISAYADKGFGVYIKNSRQ